MANLPGCKLPLPTPHYMIFALVVVNCWTCMLYAYKHWVQFNVSRVYLNS